MIKEKPKNNISNKVVTGMYFYKPKVINNLKDEMLINKNVYSCPQNLIKMHPSFDFAIKEILNKLIGQFAFVIADYNKKHNINNMLNESKIIYFDGEWKKKYVDGHPTKEGCVNISEVLYDSFNR